MVAGFTAKLHWYAVGDDDDPRWGYSRALYAYLPPRRRAIDYIGKCDGTAVPSRWDYNQKSEVWDCINEQTRHHRLIVAEIELSKGMRLTRELLGDIESLLIFEISPGCNWQNSASRGKHGRPGMRVKCRGSAWPLSRTVLVDE